MSTRLKVFLIITAIVLAITASSVIISISSAQTQILMTLETNMESMVSVAHGNVLNEINMLKEEAAILSNTLEFSGRPDIESQMEELLAGDEFFEAIAIFNAQGNRINDVGMGAGAPPSDIYMQYRDSVLQGERIISSTYRDSSGRLVFYVFAPMRSRNAIGLTVSGDFLSYRMNQFTAMSYDRISITDKDGKIIADENEMWVEDQLNFIRLAENEPAKYGDIARVIQRMISTDTEENRGVTRFTLKHMPERDFDEIIAFRPIDSTEGWSIAVSTSIAMSAYPTISRMIGFSGIIFLALGSLAAALASGVIAKPFELLKAAEKAKTAFIANMSHDMRTPLNAIISFAQLSRTKKELPKDIDNQQMKIYESGMTILGVVNDLLDISNIESGKFGVISAEYDLPGFIYDTANSNLRHIESRPVALNIVLQDRLLSKLVGDSLRIRQIFNNLLSNAMRHTAEGAVEWRISTERNGDTVWLVSSVVDSGEVIPPEDMDKLFLDYSSLDTQQMRSSKGGTGLGLALTKKIVDVMNGTITVESNPATGTVFTVRLPHKFVSDEYISAENTEKLKNFSSAEKTLSGPAEMQRIQLSGTRVLVVDDVEINIDVARGMIEAYGIQVDGVMSGRDAVELIRKGTPRYDAILMNRWMPEMDGIEAVRIIRNEIGGDYGQNVPIIAVVANAIGNNTFFLKSGFQGVLSKPINLFRLDEMIRQWVGKQG